MTRRTRDAARASRPLSGLFFGLLTTGEAGTETASSKIVSFAMGGAVLASYTLAISMDGIGRHSRP